MLGGPQERQPRLYAVVADDSAHAQALVGEYASVTNEQVEFERVLTEGDVARPKIKSGEVKQL